jgi:hypothetical protein
MDKEFKLISKEEVIKVLEAYFSWKEASSKVKKLNGRGINLSESISERLVCYLNNFSLAIGEGSYDAKSPDGNFIQIKATSNFEDDLSSFGPRSKFDFLHFARFDINKDEVWLYDIPKKDLDGIVLNRKKNETFLQQQEQGRRPHFSIINGLSELETETKKDCLHCQHENITSPEILASPIFLPW